MDLMATNWRDLPPNVTACLKAVAALLNTASLPTAAVQHQSASNGGEEGQSSNVRGREGGRYSEIGC